MSEKLTIPQKDELLYEVLRQLKSYPKELRSIVAAGIYNPECRELYVAMSQRLENETEFGAWQHAEHEVLAMNRQGQINLMNASIITTLSPCVMPDQNRPHISCTQLLSQAGVIEVHTGSLDKNQATLRKYQSLGLSVTVAANPILRSICDELNAYFRPQNRQTGIAKINYIDHALAKL